MPKSPWTKDRIAEQLRRLHSAGEDLSYNQLAKKNQALLSAAVYHFQTYRQAVIHAGLAYDNLSRRPQWTKLAIIRKIKEARRKGEDLHWAAVIQRRDALGKAAFASIQKRLFGNWNRALRAAGLDSNDIAIHRKWDDAAILYELRDLSRNGEPINPGALQKSDPGLYAAAIRRFGSYHAAVVAAKLQPAKHRVRTNWTKKKVVLDFCDIARHHRGKLPIGIRKTHPKLVSAAVRLFGSMLAAKKSAKILKDKK